MNVPVSHQAGELGIAIAGQQLDAVGSHDVASDSGKICRTLEIGNVVVGCLNFFAGTGPCGERWRRRTSNPSHGKCKRTPPFTCAVLLDVGHQQPRFACV
jgi:hypothetical protein